MRLSVRRSPRDEKIDLKTRYSSLYQHLLPTRIRIPLSTTLSDRRHEIEIFIPPPTFPPTPFHMTSGPEYGYITLLDVDENIKFLLKFIAQVPGAKYAALILYATSPATYEPPSAKRPALTVRRNPNVLTIPAEKLVPVPTILSPDPSFPAHLTPSPGPQTS